VVAVAPSGVHKEKLDFWAGHLENADVEVFEWVCGLYFAVVVVWVWVAV